MQDIPLIWPLNWLNFTKEPEESDALEIKKEKDLLPLSELLG
jgi:hypothetical protein